MDATVGYKNALIKLSYMQNFFCSYKQCQVQGKMIHSQTFHSLLHDLHRLLPSIRNVRHVSVCRIWQFTSQVPIAPWSTKFMSVLSFFLSPLHGRHGGA